MAEAPRLAIVGGESLLGQELRQVLSGSILGRNLKLVGSEEEPNVSLLSEEAGEPVVITGVDEETLAAARIVFFAGTPASTRKAVAGMRAPRPTLIDLTYTLEDWPEARLRGPSAEPVGSIPVASVSVVAHPAAIVLSAFLQRLHSSFPVRRAVAHIFEPASERGRGGVDELQQQTVDLLSFRAPAKRLFDAQLSFNLLARYGEEAPVPLQSVEQRIEKHLATLLALAGPLPMPSVRLIQAPVMHGYSISLWAELASPSAPDELRARLTCEGIDVYAPNLDPPDVVGFAGQSGMAVGAVEIDRNNSQAAWFWIVADNFRVTAENAAAVARAAILAEAAPGGSPS
jgi:aspartate-semialdehyde dehydrogenase